MNPVEPSSSAPEKQHTPLIKSRLQEVRQLFAQMEFDKAKELLHSAIIQDPNHPDLLHNLGSLYLMQSLMDESMQYYRKALKNDPGHVDAGIGLSKAFIAAQRYEEAVEALQSIRVYLDQPKDQAEFFKLIGTISSLRNDYPAAISFFKKYVDHAPHAADPYHCLYTTYMQMDQVDQAEEVLSQLVEKFPKDRVARIRQLDLWARRKALNKLNPALDQLIRDARNGPAACELAAQYYLQTHQLAYAARTVARLRRQTLIDFNHWPFLKRASTLLP